MAARFERIAVQHEFHPHVEPHAADVADDRGGPAPGPEALPAGSRPPSRALAWSPSSSMISRTARPMAQETGFPPKVLKYSMPLSKAPAISGVVTTAPRGWPLPIGFPRVTMSGTASWVSNPQKCEPTRSESHLHLVGDAHAARSAHLPESLGEIAVRQYDLPAATGQGLGDEGADAPVLSRERNDTFAYVLRVPRARFRRIALCRYRGRGRVAAPCGRGAARLRPPGRRTCTD